MYPSRRIRNCRRVPSPAAFVLWACVLSLGVACNSRERPQRAAEPPASFRSLAELQPADLPGPVEAPEWEAPTVLAPSEDQPEKSAQGERLAEATSVAPSSIIDLQKFRTQESLALPRGIGASRLELLNLNPNINRWLILRVTSLRGDSVAYHLENVAPQSQQIHLAPEDRAGLRILVGDEVLDCPLFGSEGRDELARAAASGEIFAPLCQGHVYLRNSTEGHKTSVEWATDFLRNYVWGGEAITVLVRDTFFNDAYLSTSEVVSGGAGSPQRVRPAGAPLRPRIDPAYDGFYLSPDELGIQIVTPGKQVLVGRWYPARDLRGIFVSAVQPRLVADVEAAFSGGGRLNRLDEVEASAMVYLVAFDLDQFELEFALGTEHPALTWSTRIPESLRNDALPGPDGIGNAEPLVRTGKISPLAARRVAATFIGGFKRYHGAFRYGDLALRNQGTHYGFMESGTVFSRLQPGLATLLVLEDGAVQLETWSDQDDSLLRHVRHARQNGLPLVERDAESGRPRPGRLVSEARLGNWSGSVDGRYRTVRSGVCLQGSEAGRFLIYGFFSSATAPVLARVFQAYQCSYAMLLDINALEHTYAAVYRRGPEGLEVEELIKGMNVLEKSSQGKIIPRFVGYADNRDFFYLLRKEPSS